MAWQFTDALDEVDTGYGPNLLTGDYQAQNPGWVLDGGIWSGEGSLHLHEGDPLQGPITEGDATHVVTVDVLAAGGVSVSWTVDLDTSDGPVTLGPWEDTIPAGEWVTVWQEYRTPPGTTSGSPTLTITGPAEARAPRTSRVTDQTVVRQVVVGDPDGARVVLAGDALTAYDQTGTEAARIAGEGGEFVGGSFRTSDSASEGQVMLADDGYVEPDDLTTHPGIRISPPDMSQLLSPPGLGPTNDGFIITGGQNLTGGYGYFYSAPGSAQVVFQESDGDSDISAYPGTAVVRAQRGGRASSLSATPGRASMLNRVEGGIQSEIRTNGTESFLSHDVGGVRRILSADSTGIWVKSNESGTWRHINLLGSTWQTLDLGNGWGAYSGGGGYYSGVRAQRTPLGIRLDGMIQGGSTGVVASLPADMQDVAAKQFLVVTNDGPGVMGIYGSGGGLVLGYLSGPDSPGFVSVSVDAVLA